jgi:polysaccharide export outer membrane protein
LLGFGVACSQQDFSRPVTGVRPSTVRARPPAAADADAEARSEKLATVLRQWTQANVREAKDYIVGPGDDLTISIYALEHPDETSEIQRTVSRDGKLSLPWVGNLDVRGKTLRGLEQMIVAAYADRFIKNPQVSVQVRNFKSVAVLVTGAVRNPGIYYLNDNYSTVLEMLAKAGGLNADAGDEVLVVQGSGSPGWAPAAASTNATAEMADAAQTALLSTNDLARISLRRLIDEGDLSLNAKVGAGAIVSVRSAAEQYVYVLGYVQRPGAFPIRGSQQLDALRAVALAGGLSPTARAENSFLVRETPEGQMVLPVNLAQIARGGEATVYLQPGDTLVVGSSALARLSEFVRPSVGAGMTYAPVP